VIHPIEGDRQDRDEREQQRSDHSSQGHSLAPLLLVGRQTIKADQRRTGNTAELPPTGSAVVPSNLVISLRPRHSAKFRLQERLVHPHNSPGPRARRRDSL
jgi:hypothetical protein